MDRTKRKSCEICGTTHLAVSITLAGDHLFCKICGQRVQGYCAAKGLQESDHAAVMLAIFSIQKELQGAGVLPMQRTGGDWKATEDGYVTTEIDGITWLVHCPDQEFGERCLGIEEQRVNAHLIAASPTMYDTLEQIALDCVTPDFPANTQAALALIRRRCLAVTTSIPRRR